MMIAKVEALQAWLENVTYQMNNMTYKEQSRNLAGQIAFLKMMCTRTSGEIADEAVQIFGGRGLTKTGESASVPPGQARAASTEREGAG